jgi:hypothetical protein
MPAFGTLKYPSLKDAFSVSNGYTFLTNITISSTFIEKVFSLGQKLGITASGRDPKSKIPFIY